MKHRGKRFKTDMAAVLTKSSGTYLPAHYSDIPSLWSLFSWSQVTVSMFQASGWRKEWKRRETKSTMSLYIICNLNCEIQCSCRKVHKTMCSLKIILKKHPCKLYSETEHYKNFRSSLFPFLIITLPRGILLLDLEITIILIYDNHCLAFL